MTLGPDGADVPQMFVQSAFAAGAIPIDEEEEGFVAAPIVNQERTRDEIIADGIKSMLEREEEGDFTAAGMPDRRKLSGLIGIQVSAEEVARVWKRLNESV